MTAWKYCVREFGIGVITVLTIGVLVTLLIDSIERSSLLSSMGIIQFAGIIATRLVPLVREVFPLLVCAGVAYGVGRIRSKGDLKGLLATGVPPLILLWGALTVGLFSSMVASALDLATPAANSYSERSIAPSFQHSGRISDDERNWVPLSGGALRVGSSAHGELIGVEYVSLGDGMSRVVADSAVWSQGRWRLIGGVIYGEGNNLAEGEPVDLIDLPPPNALSILLEGARLSYQSIATLGVIGTEEAAVWWHYRVTRILLVTVLAVWGFIFAAAFPLAPMTTSSLATITGAIFLSVEMMLVHLAAVPAAFWALNLSAVIVMVVIYRRRGVTLI
jgi:hypothetical protein